jgi:hypothetical protein
MRPDADRLPAAGCDEDDEGLAVLTDPEAEAFERAVPMDTRRGGADECVGQHLFGTSEAEGGMWPKVGMVGRKWR